MTTQLDPISIVTKRATNTLIKEIGVVDTIRFLNQLRVGSGNYTTERDQLFKDMIVNDIISEVKAQRKTQA